MLYEPLVFDSARVLFRFQGVSEAWEVWEMPLLIHPCYLLRRKGRMGCSGGGWDDGSEGETMVHPERREACPSRNVLVRAC